jgi:RNA polymerase sigma-70 factor (ECF subfamily)
MRIMNELPPAGDGRRPSDAHLMDRIRGGDLVALEVIYRRYRLELIAFAQRYGALSARVASEIVQEIFLDVWRRRAQWKPEHGIAAYLFGAVGHRVRRASRLSAILLDLAPEPIELFSELPQIISDLRTTVDAIIVSMPTHCREVYHLRHTYGLDVHATAMVLGVTTGTVRRHHGRALHLLVRRLATTDVGRSVRQRLLGT